MIRAVEGEPKAPNYSLNCIWIYRVFERKMDGNVSLSKFLHHVVCNMHCATDETGSHTGHNGVCPVGPRSMRGQQITSPCSLVAPKEAVTSVNSTHEASGTDLWVLGLKETRSDHQTCALWCASMCHSWVGNVTHWSYEPPPLVPPGFWCTISAGEERTKSCLNLLRPRGL